MGPGNNIESVNIRPGVSILSVLRHLNYRPWFAMAEFVDNSLQSFLDNRDELERVESKNLKLHVKIEIDSSDRGQITIRDNAAGIHASEYARAFRPAELPPDQTGLSEFGMGMKSAACWFAPQWAVRTAALGEGVERTVSFDIGAIVRDEIEELRVQSKPSSRDAHFTEITLSNLHKPLQTRTVAKIKEHLTSIYRVFIREGVLELDYDGEPLRYEEPRILIAPFYKSPSDRATTWRKDIKFDFGNGLKANGFAALRETGSTSTAGFALFRRHRLIQGSADEGYRPEKIFGRSNSYRFQRLFGELELEGFEVSHTKDGFRWDDNEDVFLDLLKEDLQSDPLPLLDQAEGYRARARLDELKKGAETATDHTAEVIEHDVPPVLEKELDEGPDARNPPPKLPTVSSTVAERDIKVELNACEWIIRLELSHDPAVGDWITVSDQGTVGAKRSGGLVKQLGVQISLAHPFMERFGGTDSSEIEPLLRVAVAIGLAETVARDSGIKYAGTFRRTINELFRDALSKP